MGEVTAARHGSAQPEYTVAVQETGGAQVGRGNIQHNYMFGPRTVTWPHRVGGVPLLADCYQHRAVSVLATSDRDGRVPQRQVLCGLGGVGKTQLAAAFVERVWQSGEVDLLLWISAASRDAIEAGYAQAAADVTGVEDTQVDRAVSRFLAWLASSRRRWLVVLDDLACPGDMAGLWPPAVLGGTTIVTTRRRDAALAGHGRLLDVGVFRPVEAHTYLAAKLSGAPHLVDDVAGLAADLGCLPLALAQAAAYLLDRDLPASGYRQRLADVRHRLVDLVPEPDALPDAHRATLALTWCLSVELADRLRPPGLARPLLVLASFLDPNGIPETVFTTEAVRRYLDGARRAGAGAPATVEQAVEGLRCLHRLSLVAIDTAGGGRAVRVHALVQRASRDQLTDEETARAARAAADALAEAWPDLDHDMRLGQALRANANILAAGQPDRVWARQCHPVLLRAGRSLGEAGQLHTAVGYWRWMCEQAHKRLGPDHFDTLAIRHDLARWQGEAGNAVGAASALQALLTDVTRVHGPDHLDALATRGTLAYWRGQAGDPAGCVAALEHLVADRLRILGADHPHTLATRCFLAYWRGQAGDAAGAVTALEELLDDRMRVLGPEHPDVLVTRHNLGCWQGQAAGPSSAVATLSELFTDLARVLGTDHPDTLATRHSLACWRGRAGDVAGAVADLSAVLMDRRRTLGADHPDTFATRHNLGFWRGRAGDATGAVTALSKLLTDVVRVLGADHPDALATRATLAHWRGRAADLYGATEELRYLLADRVRILGAGHPDVTATSRVLEFWSAPTHDATAIEESLADRLRILGTDHPADTRATRHNLAYWRAEYTSSKQGTLNGARPG